MLAESERTGNTGTTAYQNVEGLAPVIRLPANAAAPLCLYLPRNKAITSSSTRMATTTSSANIRLSLN